jgi:hypothetical protein
VNPFAAVAHWLKPAPAINDQVRAALPRVVAALNQIGTVGKLAALDSRLTRELATPVARALDYCEALVANVPGLIDIDRHAFSADPLVHALFATPADIDNMLGRSMHLRDYLAAMPAGGDEHLYAMLAMRRHEKASLGIALDGNTLRTDVPQTLLYFSDHTLVEPRIELDDTREQLRLAAFDSLLTSFGEHYKAALTARDRLRDSRTLEQARLMTVMRGKTGGEIAVRTRAVSELDVRLREVAAALQPGPLLAALADTLRQPETALRLEPIEVSIDRSGVIRDGAAAARGEADTIGFPELVARDQRHHVVVLVRIRREDAARAIAAVREQQSRFVVI